MRLALLWKPLQELVALIHCPPPQVSTSGDWWAKSTWGDLLPFPCYPLRFCASLEKRSELDQQVKLETLGAIARRGITAGLLCEPGHWDRCVSTGRWCTWSVYMYIEITDGDSSLKPLPNGLTMWFWVKNPDCWLYMLLSFMQSIISARSREELPILSLG